MVVNDKSGKPVSGLEQQDFTVIDNKLPEKILSFEAVTDATADSEPMEVVVVVDSVNISFTRVAYVRDQIKKFLQKDWREAGPAGIDHFPFRFGAKCPGNVFSRRKRPGRLPGSESNLSANDHQITRLLRRRRPNRRYPLTGLSNSPRMPRKGLAGRSSSA